jgi:phosphoglycerate dehydrogenase-like enzyme
LAELLAPFRARVIAFRRQQRGGGGVEVIDEASLPAALREADHVVDILPLNADTQGFMNAERLSHLRPGATFYNIGRGDTVDQPALIAELRSGRIHAYLDVTTPEPLPADHELWTLPGCHITPHAAGGGTGEERRQIEHFLSNLARFEKGEPLVNRVI